ncbi:hypothetical protein C4588_06520 [Candidatus Parcubacteria bacterium]|nr:MAG: hypothetical protein C4588_06520 [Candidatus Parcubacteria bacterium]
MYLQNPDEELRMLERQLALDPANSSLKRQYRTVLVRIGRGEEAGLAVGDIVRVFEVSFSGTEPAIIGGWIGNIVGIRLNDTNEFLTTVEVFNREAIEDIKVTLIELLGESRWNDDFWEMSTIRQFKIEGVPCYIKRDRVTLVTPI